MALVKNAHKIEACDVYYNMVFELPTHCSKGSMFKGPRQRWRTCNNKVNYSWTDVIHASILA
jgi:hypothetical protein